MHDDELWGALNWMNDNSTDMYNYTDFNYTDDWNNASEFSNISHWRHNYTLYRDLDNNPFCEANDYYKETQFEFDCQYGVWWLDRKSWSDPCVLRLEQQSCDYSNYNCTVEYWSYDDWSYTTKTYKQEACDFNDAHMWFEHWSGLQLWAEYNATNNTAELPYIWSHFEYQYQDSIDWSEYEDLDWFNPNCNATNMTAENNYYFSCETFG
jgi:hypothetical protein